MAWDIAVSAVLLGIAALRLPYKASKDSVEEGGKNLRTGFAAALGASGLYLFITGLAISLTWPFGFPFGGQFTGPAYAGGQYNVLFGGIATFGGLLLLATSAALFLNVGLSAVSYFAAVVGLYAVIEAYAMVTVRLTRSPELAALGYLSFAAAAFLSVPATHSDNKWLRWLFAIFAFLFAIAWLYQAANFTLGHLGVIT
jgi:uncharacterized membrane protein